MVKKILVNLVETLEDWWGFLLRLMAAKQPCFAEAEKVEGN